MRLSSLSIIIPLYNNEKTIGVVIQEAIKEGQKYARDFEIIVLNDGSRDNSFSLLANARKKHNNIRLLTHEKNLGFGATIKDLYYAAGKDYIFSIPADRQIKADVLGKLYEGLKNYDLVLGRRVVRNDSLARKIQSKVYNKLLNIFFNLNVSDVNSSKLFKREIIKRINLTACSAFVDGELCLAAKSLGYKIGEVDIEHYKDKTGQSGGGSLKTVSQTLIDLVLYLGRRLSNV